MINCKFNVIIHHLLNCNLIYIFYKYNYNIFTLLKEYNICESNPCQNQATCSHSYGKYTCLCIPGYSGVNCEIGYYLYL